MSCQFVGFIGTSISPALAYGSGMSDLNMRTPPCVVALDRVAAGVGAAPARESKAPLKVVFEFKDANAQTQMSIADETTYDYKYIVMPLRI